MPVPCRVSAARLAARIDKIPSLPQSVHRVLREIDSKRGSASTVARAIETDPPLAARVLRMSNSGAYARAARVTSVGAAVARVGTNEIRCLVMSAAIAESLKPVQQELAFALYRHAFFSAGIARLIAETSPLFDPRERDAHATAALLHDIGLLALLGYLPEAAEGCLMTAIEKQTSLRQVECATLGCGHDEVGALLLQRWRLTESEIEGARWHHRPADAPSAVGRVAFLLNLGDWLSRQQLRDPPLEVLAPGLDPETLAFLAIAPPALEDLLVRAGEVARDADELTRELLAS